jgi:Uma2 family endonuclease
MSGIAITPRYTPDDLLRMPDGDHYELIDGQLVEREMCMLASFVAGVIYHLLARHCFPKQAGWPFHEGTTYQCFPAHPNQVRKADVSVFRWERRTTVDIRAEGHCLLHPDLVVEVVSPNDEVYDVDAKVQEWLDAGVSRVWVVNPVQRTVAVHRRAGPGVILHEQDELTGDEAVPGFQCRVADLFSLPAQSAGSPTG